MASSVPPVPANGSLSSAFLQSQKKATLKDICRQKGLRVSGNKPDLIQRLEESFHGDRLIEKGPDMNGNAMSARSKRKRTMSQDARKRLKEERESIILWKKPLTTINYALRELILTIIDGIQRLLAHKLTLLFIGCFIGLICVLPYVDGPHHEYFSHTSKYVLWCFWWVGMGVLSSVGLGTGLHTFLLYLGPHIASVTMAAYECGSTDFPEPPYPDSIICPESEEGESSMAAAMTVWDILSKVRVEAFCWGAGTALGELPPYFMARAHRLSGYDPDEEEDEFDELQEKLCHPEQLGKSFSNQGGDIMPSREEINYFDRAKLAVERLVERVGFLGILACASIPNPLFDLAGITCGHFLVPFWTFFGATLIGKAIIKMHIQKVFVIMAFNENLINMAVSHISEIPIVGGKLEGPFKEMLAKQKQNFHRSSTEQSVSSPSLLAWIFEKFVLLMVLYFILSIVNSLAQSYHKRINKIQPKSEGGKTD